MMESISEGGTLFKPMSHGSQTGVGLIICGGENKA